MTARSLLLTYRDKPLSLSAKSFFVGPAVQANTTSHVLNEPPGSGVNDMLIACIASRIASSAQITLPAGWVRLNEQLNNNVLDDSNAAPSAMMAWFRRATGVPTDPGRAYTFTHPVAPSAALGRIVAYRTIPTAVENNPFAGMAGTTAVNTTNCAWTGSITSGGSGTMIYVGMTAGGRDASWSGFGTSGATNVSSGSTSNDTRNVAYNAWLERGDTRTSLGVDVSLAIFDMATTGGATVTNPVATCATASAHAMCMAWLRADTQPPNI